MRSFIFIIFIFTLHVSADEAADIVKRLDENFRGKNIYMNLSMRVVLWGMRE